MCATQRGLVSGGVQRTGYIYDAEGNRVAKGSITSFNCNTGPNGFVAETQEVIDPGGQPVTETDSSGNWQHTNVYTGSVVLATYDAQGLHFYLADPLGTRRVQTDYAGQVEGTDTSLPFGDGFTQTAQDDPTAQHYALLDFDPETGLDHAEARQYASWMGRWTAPDPYNGSYDLTNPQSMNRYVYAGNNPLSFVDPSGRDCVTVSIDNVIDLSNPAGAVAGCAASLAGDALCGPGCGAVASVVVSAIVDAAIALWPSSPTFDGNVQASQTGKIVPNVSAPSTPSTAAPSNAAPNSPQKPPCNPATRAAGVVQAASGAGDVSMAFGASAFHFGVAGLLVGAGCFDPTPAEPLTCLAAGAGAGSLGAGGLVLGSLGAYEVKDEVIPGIQQAISCVP